MSTPRPRVAAACLAMLLLLALLVAAKARAADTVPGRVVVKFASGQRAAAIDRSNLDVASVQSISMLPGTAVVQLAAGESVADAVRRLNGTRGVEWAEPETLGRTLATPSSDPLFGQQWGLQNTGQSVSDTAHPASLGPNFGPAGDDIDATDAWNLTTGSRSVLVGIVDNGVASTHEDLAANVNASLGGNAFSPGGSTEPGPADDGFHGTHVAGIVGAVGNNGIGVTGVNWQVTMLPIVALGYNPALCGGSDSCGTSVQIASALSMAASHGARVVNASIGGPADTDSHLESEAVNANGSTLYVFAAGNDGTDNDQQPVFPCNIDAPNVICVARSQIDDSLASNSNYGATTVDLAAPGGRILSTLPPGSSEATQACSSDAAVNCYGMENGTSMASPMVAGVAALILSRNPWSSPAQIKDAILSSVDVKPAFAGKTVTGGRLNAYKALLASDDTVPPTAFSLTAPGDGLVTSSGSTGVSWTQSNDAKSGVDHYSVIVDGAQVATAPASATSASVPIGDGSHTLAVRAVDQAGNATSTPSETITVDRTSPTNPGGGGPLNGSFVTTTRPTIEWTPASDVGSGLAGYDVSLDGGAPTRVIAAATSFTPANPLAQGLHRWNVKAVDRAGNASGGLTGSFFIDTVAPDTPSHLTPSGTSSDDSTPRLSWDAITDDVSGLAYYEIVVDDGTPRRITDPVYTPQTALVDGAHSWTVRAVDVAGNTSPRASAAFTVDTRAPRASATAVSAGAGRVRVRCRTTETGRCAAKVVASAATAKRLHLGRRALTVGSGSASIRAPGRSVTVKLSRRARTALRRFGGARMLVRVTVTDAAGNAVHRSVSATVR